MANVKKAHRVQDIDIKRLNHVGLGLKAIAEHLGCHAATVTLRLKAMNIEPTDTRRSFMEQVFFSLTPDQQDWLSHNLFNAGIGVKEFVSTLITEAYQNNPGTVPAAASTELPEMDGGHSPPNFSEEPSPDEQLEPEYVSAEPETAPATLPPKPKLKFK